MGGQHHKHRHIQHGGENLWCHRVSMPIRLVSGYHWISLDAS